MQPVGELAMNDTLLWMAAVGSGLLGLLLLLIAGAVALYWKVATPAASRRSHPRADTASTREAQQPVVAAVAGGSLWLWFKAWIFAMIHAGTVSLVLGGITFFEDIARASEEIHRSGTVTFPRQLLPGALSEASSNRHLPRPEGKKSSTGKGVARRLNHPAASSSPVTWEVVGEESVTEHTEG